MRAVEYADGIVKILDQTLLPHKTSYIKCKTTEQIADAINSMKVRGAPAISIAAAYGMALNKNPEKAAELLKSTRPTAVDLTNAVDFVLRKIQFTIPPVEAAKDWENKISDSCKKASEHASLLLNNGHKILTHCNTGYLAANMHGTALGAIKIAHEMGKNIHIYTCETRPRCQGALASFELLESKIPHTVIVDSCAGWLMKQEKIDMVMLGADRIVKNGDLANKIGTYQLALLAKEHNIPFYVVAPLSSFDFNLDSGEKIPIEERSGDEILKVQNKQLYPKATKTYNPAFDVTPGGLVRSYVNEFGIFRNMKEIENLWRRNQ